MFYIYSNFYNVSNRLVSIAENCQKAVKNHQKAAKMPPTGAPILTKRFVLYPCTFVDHIQVPSSYRSQDIIELHLKPPKSGGNAAKVSCRILFTFDSCMSHFKSLALTVLEIFCLQTDRQTDRQTEGQTHGPMAETLDLGSRDLKTRFGTKN
jgi:hypothetical protein